MLLNSTRISDRLICRAELEGAEGGAAGAGAGGAGDGGQGAGAGAGSGAGAGADAPFYETFKDEGLRTSPSVQGFKTVEELAKGYVNAEKRLGVPLERHLVLPADPKDAEAYAAIFGKLGRPEKPDGYGFKLDDKASDADKAFLERALPALHGANLTRSQAEEVFKFWMGESEAAAKASAEAAEARVAEGAAAVKKEWGHAYGQRAKEVGSLLTKYGAPNIAAELDSDEKLGSHPELAIFLGKVLDAMAEPGSAGGESGDAASGRALTPSQAKAEANRLEAHPAFRDRSHPEHKAIVEARLKFLEQAEPKAA